MQLCELENQTLEAFVAASRSYIKYDCAVARQYLSLLVTAHDCETGLYALQQHMLMGVYFSRPSNQLVLASSAEDHHCAVPNKRFCMKRVSSVSQAL